MNEPWKNLQPKDTFFVHQAQLISDVDLKVLNILYRPLIGVGAFSLYHAFLSMVKVDTFDSQEMFHADLFNELDMGLTDFYQARLRLEGVGLLRTFERDGQKNWLYLLEKPSSYHAFIQDDLLSLMLLNKVGERRFNRLMKEFPQDKQHFVGFSEKTKKFVDVYPQQEVSLLAKPALLENVQQQLAVVPASSKTAGITSFDWAYFSSLMNEFQLASGYLERVQSELLAIHQLFGFDEMTLKKQLVPYVDYQKNELMLAKFKQSLATQPTKKPHIEKNESKSNQQESQSPKTSAHIPAKETLSASEQALVATSEYYAPMPFLEKIKQSKQGLVVITERWAIEKLVKQTNFSNSVLNILIHYLLVAKNRQNVEEIEAFKIANEWSQVGITTPEAAISYMREKEQKKTSQPPKKTYYKANKVRKETLPDWVDKDQTETPMSEVDQAFFKEQLRQLRSQQKEGE